MKTEWHGDRIKNQCNTNIEQVALKVGFAVEAEAKEIITVKVYNRPQRGRYKRTGLARASIQTELKKSQRAVYVGADKASFIKKANEINIDIGSGVFYLPYLEHGTRFSPPIGMLRGGLDRVRRKLGR